MKYIISYYRPKNQTKNDDYYDQTITIRLKKHEHDALNERIARKVAECSKNEVKSPEDTKIIDTFKQLKLGANFVSGVLRNFIIDDLNIAHDWRMLKRNTIIRILWSDIKFYKGTSVIDKVDEGFAKLMGKNPDIVNIADDLGLIRENLAFMPADVVQVRHFSDIDAINVAYRFHHDFLLSVIRVHGTESDFITFNFYHKRELLVGDICSISLLVEYMRKILKNEV